MPPMVIFRTNSSKPLQVPPPPPPVVVVPPPPPPVVVVPPPPPPVVVVEPPPPPPVVVVPPPPPPPPEVLSAALDAGAVARGEVQQTDIAFVRRCTDGLAPARQLGKGGFGAVYRGFDERTGLVFAAKARVPGRATPLTASLRKASMALKMMSDYVC